MGTHDIPAIRESAYGAAAERYNKLAKLGERVLERLDATRPLLAEMSATQANKLAGETLDEIEEDICNLFPRSAPERKDGGA